MARIPIHRFDQGLFSKTGMCYWACDFMIAYHNSSTKGAWYDYTRQNYAKLKQEAKNFVKYQPCATWAKSKGAIYFQNISANYLKVNGALAANRVYRVLAYAGTLAQADVTPNHAILCVTGPGTELLIFDPNDGFYELSNNEGQNNRETLEQDLAALYTTPITNFMYKLEGQIKV